MTEDWTTAEEINAKALRQRFPAIDWATFWNQPAEKDWIIPSVLPAGGQIVIYSPAKMGKSLLALEICAALATGRTVLGHVPKRAYRVTYVDYENDPDDIHARLADMGYGPGDDLSNLEILPYAALMNLDTPAGGQTFLDRMKLHGPEIVVIDTMSRVNQGRENDNDTYNDFYKYTGLGLKRACIALIRLDHSGKDESKGQRGGSAKNSDVDAVWRLSESSPGRTFRLTCEMSRHQVPDKVLTIHRESMPLCHRLAMPDHRTGDAMEARIDAIIDVLDAAGLPDDVGRRIADRTLRDAGSGARPATVTAALRRRQMRLETSGTHPQPELSGTRREHVEP
ncbi:AAA family ATPase [Pseudarthrobacter psychrotolerans]|uniref:AAA family ATPase n=1 Tax=Pseudarthrobacter psychrotolerans TaxID=2697569 RepID=A0A6P1NL02_9MICC|nr:AAA family ATPase [Pseudarthrobacter psychrotolerans]QHK19723.1 AAA family ATPase [Pseudarthrobacter psychrotolerans]